MKKMMKKRYYGFWVRVILNAKKNKSNGEVWKFPLFVVITTINSLNIVVIDLWLRIFNIDIFNDFNYGITSGTIIDNLAIFTIKYSTPFILFNYFLIFHKRRYEMLIEKYPPDNSKYPIIYLILSIVICFISLIIYSFVR